jgi:enoyl-CoA hydratase/carnithine racemase
VYACNIKAKHLPQRLDAEFSPATRFRPAAGAGRSRSVPDGAFDGRRGRSMPCADPSHRIAAWEVTFIAAHQRRRAYQPPKESRMKTYILVATLLVAVLVGTNLTRAGEPAMASGTGTDAASKQEIRLERVTPEYWRITFDNPPFNLFGPETIPQLNSVITQIETDTKVKVVVFQSAVPGFFLTHFDFVPPLSATTDMPPGVTGLPALPDMLVRLSRAPVVSIVSIRGRTTGVGGELSLASDMRFASREKAALSQWEIGAGLVPGGGPMARLPRLIGRGRALEMLLSGEDISADLAERYGYVNRALPDAELDQFVDTLARRIAGFDKQAIAAIKRLVDIPTLPSDIEIGAEWSAFLDSAHRPQAQQNIKRLMEMGLQTKPDVEKRLPYYTGTLTQ